MPAAGTPEPPDPLDPWLDRLGQATPPPSGSIAPEVWRRIHAAEQPDPAPGPGWWERVHAAFGRTSFAAAFVAACVLLGLFLAEVRSSRMQAARGAELARSYVRLIDPLLADPATRHASTP